VGVGGWSGYCGVGICEECDASRVGTLAKRPEGGSEVAGGVEGVS
jgi:hypothetical protein